ncbi:MAG: hypothetical protein ACRDJ5_11780 [Actinomycetota bacterium]
MDTFLVRVWSPAQAGSPDTRSMRGEVRHVRSGAATAFVGEGELLEFIVERSARTEASPGRRPPSHSSHRKSARRSGLLSLQEWLSFGSDPDA